VVGLLLIGSAAASSFLLAAAARLRSPISSLLVAYLSFVGSIGVVTIVLSPLREVTRGGLAVAEAVILVAALAVWSMRGRPSLPVAAARAAVREAVTDLPTALFLAIVAVLFGYELLLGFGVPPNNGDVLAYHLTKAAAWAQHGGMYWIPNAPTARLNAFQPFAEQQLLFLFMATGGGALIAVPQLLAELAILVAVYGASRRLGFTVRASACGAALFATFSLVALEAVTAQNDLVAASFPAVAACLLLGGGGLEAALAGAAVGVGLGAKLTTALVVPVLLWLALLRGRTIAVLALSGAAAGLVAIGMWGYVQNLAQTGHVLGVGTAGIEDRASPAYPRSVANAFDLVYGLMDGSVLSSRLIHALAIAGVAGGLGVAASRWRSKQRRALGEGVGVAIPFIAPLLVIGGAAAVSWGAGLWGFPLRGAGGIIGPLNANLNLEYGRISNENYSAFGPVGVVALVVATVLTLVACVTRRVDPRHLALACAFPLFLILVSLTTAWNPFLIRFFLVPAVLAAPLLARLFPSRAVTLAYAVAAGLTAGLTIIHDQTKPLHNPYGLGVPWELTQVGSLTTNSNGAFAIADAKIHDLLPAGVCIGSVSAPWEPTYLLYGPRLQHRVFFLPPGDPLTDAIRHNLGYVAISAGTYASAADAFTRAGWSAQPIGGLLLATAPHAAEGTC
jgi:Glycosyltransferase family 87